MARRKSQKPKDRKNVSNRVFGRYAFRDGQMHSIHGMTNFQVDTAESQVFGFYSNTGQGATEGGPGTVRHFYIRQACQLRFLEQD